MEKIIHRRRHVKSHKFVLLNVRERQKSYQKPSLINVFDLNTNECLKDF